MAYHSQYIGTPKGGYWSATIGSSWAYTTRDGRYPAAEAVAPGWTPTIPYPAASNGSIITCIHALPLGTNTNAITAFFWVADPIDFQLRLVGSRSLGTSTAPAAGSQYSNPTGGVIDCTSVLPISNRPSTRVAPGTPVRSLYINPGWYIGISSDNPAGSGGPGWQINFYGGDW